MIHGKLILYTYDKPTKKGFPVKVKLTNGITKKVKYYNLKEYSFLNDWDQDLQEPKTTHPEYYFLLEEVQEQKLRITKLLRKSKKEKYSLEKCLKLISNEDIQTDFFLYCNQYFEYQIELAYKLPELKRNSKLKTIKQKEFAVNHFKTFVDEIQLSEITRSVLKKYVEFSQSKMTNNGIHSYLTALRSIYNVAVLDEVIDSKMPFKGIMPKKDKTKDKYITADELRKIINNNSFAYKLSYGGGIPDFKNYFLFMFYMGGLDFIDLKNLKKNHIVNGRLKFVRFKGTTTEKINNIIPSQAKTILEYYNNKDFKCGDYLFPINNFNYDTIIGNMNKVFRKWFNSIGGESYISSKSPRYTFTKISEELELNRFVRMQIMGHSLRDTASIYEGGFSDKIRDELHLKVISFI